MKTNGNTKSLASYIHLYIGSKVWTSHLALNNGEPQALTISINNLYEILYKYQDSKLILRPLSDMTKEEAEAIAIIMFGHPDSVKWRLENKGAYLNVYRKHYHRSFTIDLASGDIDIYDDGELQTTLQHHYITVYLLSRGFDLFGLIDAGLAINAKDTQNQTNNAK